MNTNNLDDGIGIGASKRTDLSEFRCRKCDGQNLGRNGAQIRSGTRFQRLICRSCKYIWIEYSLLMPDRELVVSNQPKSTFAAQAQSPARDKPIPVNPSEPDFPRLEIPKINPAKTGGQQMNSGQVQTPRKLENSNASVSTMTAFPSRSTNTPVPFRRLELEAPTDWSPTGVLAYTQHAQQALQQALAQFDHPSLAELELQRLEPRIREYVRARQAFDTALMLQWAAVFTGPVASLGAMYGTHLEQPQIRPREATMGSREPAASSLGGRDQSSNDDPDDPEHSDQT